MSQTTVGKLITFDPGDRHLDSAVLLEFWDSMRGWFAERGYHLYEFLPAENGGYAVARSTIIYNPHPNLNPEKKIFDAGEDPFPYAYVGGDPTKENEGPEVYYYASDCMSGRVMFAQDNVGRHVAIKLVKGGSEEDRITNLLMGHTEHRKRETFCSIIPIIDRVPCEGHFFAVMPRWRSYLPHPPFPKYNVVVQQIVSLLKGLVFLHDNRIFHRDLRTRNMLVNHFSNARSMDMRLNLFHWELIKRGDLICTICDFDFSILLDEETYGPHPRLPIDEADVGYNYPPFESISVQLDFDPFKYDVALLGIWFSDVFQHIIPTLPLLAPLIDRMVTSQLDKRFTAKEALAFAETIIPTAPDDLIFIFPPLPATYCFHDRWKGLPEDFVAKWSDYREDRTTFSYRFFLFLARHFPAGLRAVYLCRKTSRILLYLPRMLVRHISYLPRLILYCRGE